MSRAAIITSPNPIFYIAPASSRLPLALKLVVTAFVVVRVPVYYVNHGPTNFLYFCDIALLCMIALWTERVPPAAGAVMVDPKILVNINYVFGFDDAGAQTWRPGPVYLLGWMATLLVACYLPTHLVLRRVFRRPAAVVPPVVAEPMSGFTPA